MLKVALKPFSKIFPKPKVEKRNEKRDEKRKFWEFGNELFQIYENFLSAKGHTVSWESEVKQKSF